MQLHRIEKLQGWRTERTNKPNNFPPKKARQMIRRGILKQNGR
jgi:hypothetical protein